MKTSSTLTMSEFYTSDMLGVVIAQIAQTIGYSSTQSGPLELLQDVLQRFIQELARDLHCQAEHANRFELNIKDVVLSLKNVNINVNELLNYIGNVEPIAFVREVPAYPVKRRSNLNFLKPGSAETLSRPVHIFEYLPAILPPEPTVLASTISADKPANESLQMMLEPCQKIANKLIPTTNQTDSTMTLNSLSKDKFDHNQNGLRELSSVVMTTGGFISPAIEGKLPEAFVPDIIGKLKGLDAPPVAHVAKTQDDIVREPDDDFVSNRSLLESQNAKQGPTMYQTAKSADSNGVSAISKASTTPDHPELPNTKTTKKNKKKKLIGVCQIDQTSDLNTLKAQEKAQKKALKLFQKLSKNNSDAAGNITGLQKSIKNSNRGTLSALPDGSTERAQLEKYIKKQTKQRQKQQKSHKQQRQLQLAAKVSETIPNTTQSLPVPSKEPGSFVPLTQPVENVIDVANTYLGSTVESKYSFQTNLINDTSCGLADDLSEAIKLANEPDRNKLNIFKKISKPKAQNTFNIGKTLYESPRNNSPLISLPSGTTITPATDLTATENISIAPHKFNMSLSNISTSEGLSGISLITKNIIDLNKPRKRGRKPGGKNQARPKLYTSNSSTSFQSPKKIKSTKPSTAVSIAPDAVLNKNPLHFSIVPSPIEPRNLSSADQRKDTQLIENVTSKGENNSEGFKIQKAKERKERKKDKTKNNHLDNDNVEATRLLDSDRHFKKNIGLINLENISKTSTPKKELTFNESADTFYKSIQMQSAEMPDCITNQNDDYVSGSRLSNFSNSTIYATTQPNMLPMIPLLHFPPHPGLIPSGLGIFPPTSLTGFGKKVVGNASSNMIMPHSFMSIANAGQSATVGYRPSLFPTDENVTQTAPLPHIDNYLERSYCNVAPLVPEYMKLPNALSETNKSKSPDSNRYEVKPSYTDSEKESVQNSYSSILKPVAQELGMNYAHVNQSFKSTKAVKHSPPPTGNLGDPIEVSDDSNDEECKTSTTTNFESYSNLQCTNTSIIQPSNLSMSGPRQQTEKSLTTLLNANSLHSPTSDCKKDVKASLKIIQSESNPLQSLSSSPRPSQFNINFMSNDKFSLAGGADLIPLSRVESGLAYSSLTVPATSLAAGATSGSMPSIAAFQDDNQHFLKNFVGSVNYDDITITPTNKQSISELTLRKLHKKIKKTKDGKIKKKKDKKDKIKHKEKGEENNAINIDIDKTRNQDKKMKKNKKKAKQVTPDGIPLLQGNIGGSLHNEVNLPSVAEIAVEDCVSLTKCQAPPTHQIVSPNQVPKLTLKLNGKSTSSASPFEGDHDSTVADSIASTPTQTKKEHSPELARFSPLVTGPPKHKPCETQIMSQHTALPTLPTCSSVLSSMGQAQTMSLLGVQATGLNASSSGWISSSETVASATLSASSVLLPQQLMQPSKHIHKVPALSPSTFTSAVASSLQFKSEVPRTVPPACAELNKPSSYVDAEGYRIWICPACGKVDDGSAMIGCDGCDAWYHWTCVGIHVAPNDNEDWFCRVCICKKKVSVLDKKKKRHKKK